MGKIKNQATDIYETIQFGKEHEELLVLALTVDAAIGAYLTYLILKGREII